MSDQKETSEQANQGEPTVPEPNHSEALGAPKRVKGKPSESWYQKLLSFDLASTLGRSLGLDLRSLGVFRIAFGILVLSDVYHRMLHLTAHYTDQGFMPRSRLLGGWSQPLFYSFNNWGGDVTSQVILFAVTAVFGLMFLVGFKTRLASIMTFILIASVQGRNYLILQGGDDLLRVMLFWGMFVPLGARFSVDAALAGRTDPEQAPNRIFTIASMTLALQLLAMYAVSAALKTGPTWHAQGSAIHLALHHHAFATPFGMWFRELPRPVLQYMTWSVFYIELFGPLLFFLPFKNDWARTLQPLLFISFHFGLFLTMELGHFPWVAMAAWLVMFPSWFWDGPVNALVTRLGLEQRLAGLARRTGAFIATHRRWFRSRRPGTLRIRPTLFGTVLVSLLAIYTAYGTAFAATHKGEVEGKQFDPLLVLRLYANWGMFAPNPPNTSGWFVMVGKRKDGKQVDVWNGGGPVSWEKPDVPSATYRTQRWRKFLDNIVNPRHAVVRPYFLKWLCRDWNEQHEDDEQVRSITMYQVSQTVRWPEKGYTPTTKKNLQRQGCPAVPSHRKK